MKIPTTIPYFKVAAGFVLIYSLLWMALEGELGRDLALATAVALLAAGFAITRFLGGQTVSKRQFVILTAVVGLAVGVALPLLTIFLMALKTGIHAHGPEYTPGEIAWVLRQLPLWAGVGGLSGLGIGLLAAAARH